jgi:hypothetical protein
MIGVITLIVLGSAVAGVLVAFLLFNIFGSFSLQVGKPTLR